MISLQSVDVTIDGRSVLKDLNVTLTEKRVGVIGFNGSGKSTFSRLLNGLQKPTGGSMDVMGFDPTSDGKALRRKVGFVFQNPDNQIVYPVVSEDLAFGLKNLKLGKAETEQRITDTLKQYNLNHLADRFTHELSGGEKQMVALLGVLVMQPELIVLDEPTTLLDYRNKNRLMSVVEGLPQPVVLVTHDLDLLADFDRVLLFHEGELYADGAPADVIARYLELGEA